MTTAKNLGGRPANDPGIHGWNPDAAQLARMEAGITVRSIRDSLEDDFGIVLSERSVDNYFAAGHSPSSRAPRAEVADAIATILGVDRADLGR